jgi:hypothetical protein
MSEFLKKNEIKKACNHLPHLPPDLYDDFVTWIYDRYDLQSFIQSTMNFKNRELKKFLKACTDEQLQYSLNLCD